MAKKTAPTKAQKIVLSSKTREVEIKKDLSKTYPKELIPMSASLKAVREIVVRLEGMGFTHVQALETLAAQMHATLVELKKSHAKKGGK